MYQEGQLEQLCTVMEWRRVGRSEVGGHRADEGWHKSRRSMAVAVAIRPTTLMQVSWRYRGASQADKHRST